MTKDNEIALRAEIEHIFSSGANEIRVFNMVKAFIDIRAIKLNSFPIPSHIAMIDYIENDAEIAMPIDEFFNEDGTNITKKTIWKSTP